jgi:ferredoxin--NADP+ reductase
LLEAQVTRESRFQPRAEDRFRLLLEEERPPHVSVDELADRYDAVVYAVGTQSDRTIGIPGEDLPGSVPAVDFVGWYNAHPHFAEMAPDISTGRAVVVGNGNVALDVARMLAKHADDLLPTEIPANVYSGLKASPVTDVHVFGRRGPAQAKFSPLELRELGELNDVDMVVYDEDFVIDAASQNAIETNKQVFVLMKVMNAWRERESNTASRRLHLHFYAKPLEVVANERGTVGTLRFERTEPDAAGGVRGTGEIRELEIGAIYRAVGYFGSPLDGIPFDEKRGVIPNREGQVIDDEGKIMPGIYATGWIKRGPIGLIGHTKSDAMETVKHLLRDQAHWWEPAEPAEQSVVDLLNARGIEFTDAAGWAKLDEYEKSLGVPEGRERIKAVDRAEMIRVSRA